MGEWLVMKTLYVMCVCGVVCVCVVWYVCVWEGGHTIEKDKLE